MSIIAAVVLGAGRRMRSINGSTVMGCGSVGRLSAHLRTRYAGRVMPWYFRWSLPPERPMLLLVGRRGKGKTAVATKIVVGRMRAGERVYANFEIEVDGMRAGRVYSLLQCLDLRDCTVVIDEANSWANARLWAKIPPSVLASWQQSRKKGVSFIFTAQHEERVEKVIRELADFVLLCERTAILPRWVPLFRVQRTWLEEISEIRRGRLSRAEYYWIGDDILGAYDTNEEVDPAQLESLNAYKAAIESGQDPSELGIDVPERREPAEWVEEEQCWVTY